MRLQLQGLLSCTSPSQNPGRNPTNGFKYLYVYKKELSWWAWDPSPWKALLARLAFGWHLGTQISGGFPPSHTQEWLTVPKFLIETKWFVLNTCFPSASLGFGYTLDRGCLHDWLPIKTLSTESRRSLSGGHVSHLSQSVPWRIKHVLGDSTGENSWKFAPGFPWILPREPFPFLEFALEFYKMIKDKMDFYSFFFKKRGTPNSLVF